jgi:hypothetical protein
MPASSSKELPKATQDREEWQIAIRALLLVVEHNGDTLPAYIGIKRALSAGKPRPPRSPRKKAAKKYRIVGR